MRQATLCFATSGDRTTKGCGARRSQMYKQRQEEYKHRIGPKVRYNDLRVYLYECAQVAKDKKHRVQYG